MRQDFTIEACNVVNRFLNEQGFTDFRYAPETIQEYPFMMAVARLLYDIDKDFRELTYDQLKGKYMVNEQTDPLKTILTKYIEDDDLLDKALDEIDAYLEPKFTITPDDIVAAAQALCRADGATWWTDENIKHFPTNATPQNLNQHWIDKATTVFQCLVDKQ